MLLLVYHDAHEPITREVLKRHHEINDDFVAISLATLLHEVEIFDCIESGVPQLQWTLPRGRIITNDENVRLVNRVMSISNDLFNDFHEDDRQYASQEFWAYLSFALESFRHKTASPCFLGLSGPHAPLPYQWFRASQLGLRVPQYYMGARGHLPYATDNPRLVLSNAYNFYSWKPNVAFLTQAGTDAYDPSAHVFAFERPLGTPVSAFVAGDKVILNISGDLSRDWDEAGLKEVAKKVASDFSVHFGEILFFVNGLEVTFGTFILTPSDRTSYLSSFSDTVIESLERWVKTC